MKSHVKKIMEEKGVTIRFLMARVDELFPRISEKTGEKRATAMATIMNARDDAKIETCTLLTLKMIARALGVSVHDLFTDQPDQE